MSRFHPKENNFSDERCSRNNGNYEMKDDSNGNRFQAPRIVDKRDGYASSDMELEDDNASVSSYRSNGDTYQNWDTMSMRSGTSTISSAVLVDKPNNNGTRNQGGSNTSDKSGAANGGNRNTSANSGARNGGNGGYHNKSDNSGAANGGNRNQGGNFN